MEDLAKDLERRVAASRNLARFNYSLAYFLYVAAVLASIVATLSAAFELGKVFTAILAAAPGAVISINSIFRFEDRAPWHRKIMGAFGRLARGLRFEGR